jgi:hypothetical protein
VGTRTDAALAQVVAARADLAHEVDTLEAATRAAVDIPAKIKRSPGKAAAVAGGAAFLVVGGPQKVFRRARRTITGREQAPLPKTLLPKDIEKTLKKLGTDGDKVRGTIERDFAHYLDERAEQRRNESFRAAILGLTTSALRPVGFLVGRRLLDRMTRPDQAGFEEQLQRIRERTAALSQRTPTTEKVDPGSGAGPESGLGI